MNHIRFFRLCFDVLFGDSEDKCCIVSILAQIYIHSRRICGVIYA